MTKKAERSLELSLLQVAEDNICVWFEDNGFDMNDPQYLLLAQALDKVQDVITLKVGV